MIEYLKGTLADLQPAIAVVECGGVGYEANISLNTYTALQQKVGNAIGDNGIKIKLYIEEQIREDAHVLYGFATKGERELFRLLITVSGVGASTTRIILSSLSPQELCDVISSGNEKLLKTVKGIGLKTAQRIIIDLKDKIVGVMADMPSMVGNVAQSVSKLSAVGEEAVAALTALGFSPAPSHKAVTAIIQEEPDASVERVIKLALKRM